MSNAFPTYDPNLLTAFHELEDNAYRDVIHFFERYQEAFYLLDTNDYVACKYRYAEALYELGKHQQYLEIADELIEDVMHHNIRAVTENQKDVFQDLLFHKAASYYHLVDYEKANYLLEQLLRINPDHKAAAYLFRKSRVKNAPVVIDRLNQFGILGILLSATLTSVELLVIRTFYVDYIDFMVTMRNVTLFTAVGGIAMAEIGHRLSIYFIVRKHLKKFASKKRSR